MDVKIEPSWKEVLHQEFDKPYFEELTTFVKNEYKSRRTYPHASKIFAAFNETPFHKVKVVILGQDPYHGVNQANGLAFSVSDGVKTPPSLVNIYKEIQQDLKKDIPASGNLERWAKQGVLLLNATLTVSAGSPGSHQNKGWETFTDAVIKQLNEKRQHLVYLLWGSYAQKKGEHIDNTKNLVLTSAHPSPFSVDRGFFGSKPFSQTNAYLVFHDQEAIDW
jgi:uracil-DNA glycosylase